jgi:hypothetical protein
MWKISKQKLNLNSAKKVAFLAVFGVTGVAAFAAYHYVKTQLSKLDEINWDEV